MTMASGGVVTRVSGPVAIASGLEGVKMYDVVRVGELGLIGEVIRLEGNSSTIQVYEDTTGVRPGDSVVNTKQALSVELGPGLLTSIYDGIQRPLNLLRQKSGDFISRGLVIPPLDEGKKWEFQPVKRKGDRVEEGEILGLVQETPLIAHKIMLPIGMKGDIRELDSGSFSIRDPIGALSTPEGSMDLFLATRWTVRTPRPFKRKLPPDTPLITGQRVLDTFFPVTKGGTAAIPGPFGSGKCVLGDTPVLLGDGSFIEIEELYRKWRDHSHIIDMEGEEVLELPEDIHLFSFVGSRMVRSRTRTIYRGFSDTVIHIKTSSGREVKVTPVHKLFTIDSFDRLVEKEARFVRPGDRIAAVSDLSCVSSVSTKEKAEILRLARSLVSREERHAGTLSDHSETYRSLEGVPQGVRDAEHKVMQSEVTLDSRDANFVRRTCSTLLRLGIRFRLDNSEGGMRLNFVIPDMDTYPRNLTAESQSDGTALQAEHSIFADEVTSTYEIQGPFPVYDLSLPDYGQNFVGGEGGLLLHNTVTQQQLAKWSDSNVVVYVGCGERGNEMTEVLVTFPELKDPKSGRPLLERTILVANTSNMPVAAREASIYTGITMAEYYRDMGYDVALMADSTSRWAEALREISGRLEEMPGEEGYPAYLGKRLAEFYERSGRVVVLSPEERIGSVTIVGAVSPPGGDFSEPVSQNTLRVTRVFWALDASLAGRRHFPAINWLTSYSLYAEDLAEWGRRNVAKDWPEIRAKALEILQKESELQDIVQLVGYDALPETEKGILDVAKMIREDYLQQSAFDEVDTYSSIRKQYLMLKTILEFGSMEADAIKQGAQASQVSSLEVKNKISRLKWTPESQVQQLVEEIARDMKEQFESLIKSVIAA